LVTPVTRIMPLRQPLKRKSEGFIATRSQEQ
jgi:hypothetical protein